MRHILLFLIIISISGLSAQVNFTEKDHTIIRTLFGGNWLEADSLIDLEIKKKSLHPKYHFFKAYNCFYGRYISSSGLNRDTVINRVSKYSLRAIELGEKFEENPEIKFYLGNAYALLARVEVMDREYWDAYWSAEESEDYLEDLIDEHPEFYDSYLNIGVMEYFSAVAITGFRGFLAWLGGMSGDRELGLNYFDKVVEQGSLFKDEARYILGVVYGFRENDRIKAYDNWHHLALKYPENQMFAGQRDRAHLYITIEEKGVKFLDDEFDRLSEVYNVTNSAVLNTFGYTLMNRERLDDALKVFQTNIKLYPAVANCYDSIAECYMNRGNNEKAVEFYNIAFDKLSTDTTINDQFRDNLREGIKEQLDQLGAAIE